MDFGAGPVVVERGLRILALNDPVPMPVDGPINWSALDNLPALITIEWSGLDRGVVAAAAAHGVRFLYWSDAEGDVDLSGTSVEQVRLGGAGLRGVRLPRSIKRLQLNDPPLPDLSVEAPDHGHGRELQLFWRTANREQIRVPAGLDRVTSLWLWADREVTLSVLEGLADLEELQITFDSPPGTLTDLSALQMLPALHTLEFDSAYDWDPGAFPELPRLRRLVLNGVRRTAADTMKATLKGGRVKLTVRAAKTETWLAAHMFNPFRDWIHDGKAFGTAACMAYTRARTAVDAAPSTGPDRSPALEAAVRGLVAELNVIDARHKLIDTINRDYAVDVLLDLAHHAGIPTERAEQWIHADRRW